MKVMITKPPPKVNVLMYKVLKNSFRRTAPVFSVFCIAIPQFLLSFQRQFEKSEIPSFWQTAANAALKNLGLQRIPGFLS